MSGASTTERNARLSIVMDKTFAQFSSKAKKNFLRDLAYLTGTKTDEFQRVEFLPGCVLFSGDLDEAAVERLVELYAKMKAGKTSPEIEFLREFVDRHCVRNVNATFQVQLQIVPKTEERHLVFVHGWRGEANSFGRMPEFLSMPLDCETSIYEYPTGIWQHSPSIVYVARNLENWIRNNVRAKRLAIVAHSLGGLVVRKFLINQRDRKKPLDTRVKQVTLIASPHDGAALAKIGKHVPFLKSAQLEELSPRSPVLFELSERWQHWTQERVPKRCIVRSIFGTADSLVSETNARGLDPEAVPILGADHQGIVKANNARDEVVQTTIRFMQEAKFAIVRAETM